MLGIKIYVVTALILSALSMTFGASRNRLLSGCNRYELLAFFALLPLIALREIFYALAGMLKRGK